MNVEARETRMQNGKLVVGGRVDISAGVNGYFADSAKANGTLTQKGVPVTSLCYLITGDREVVPPVEDLASVLSDNKATRPVVDTVFNGTKLLIKRSPNPPQVKHAMLSELARIRREFLPPLTKP